MALHSGQKAGRRGELASAGSPRRAPRSAPLYPGSRSIGAGVAIAAFIWLAATTQHGMPWDMPGESARITLRAVVLCGYLAGVFVLLAPRLHARLSSGRSPASTAAYLFEGTLWHALCAPFLIFAGPGVYLCFAAAGGLGMAAFRWLNAAR